MICSAKSLLYSSTHTHASSWSRLAKNKSHVARAQLLSLHKFRTRPFFIRPQTLGAAALAVEEEDCTEIAREADYETKWERQGFPSRTPSVHVRVRLPIYRGTVKEGFHVSFILSLLHDELSAGGF